MLCFEVDSKYRYYNTITFEYYFKNNKSFLRGNGILILPCKIPLPGRQEFLQGPPDVDVTLQDILT